MVIVWRAEGGRLETVRQMPARPFSVGLYLLIVFGFSWPFQLVFAFLGEAFRPILLLSMLMAGIGTFVAGRYVFRDGFEGTGWRLGRPRHYLFSVALAALLWVPPVFMEHIAGWRTVVVQGRWDAIAVTLATSFGMTLLPAFAEEFSWRGYLLPRLLKRYTCRRALLAHGLITWLWHVPFIVAAGIGLGGGLSTSVPLVLIVSVIPTVLHAVVFAWLWWCSGSVWVSTVYHAAFDEVRDTLEQHVGFGVLSQNWQAAVLTILGGVLLRKVPWGRAKRRAALTGL
jgi:uncharacterized protein